MGSKLLLHVDLAEGTCGILFQPVCRTVAVEAVQAKQISHLVSLYDVIQANSAFVDLPRVLASRQQPQLLLR